MSDKQGKGSQVALTAIKKPVRQRYWIPSTAANCHTCHTTDKKDNATNCHYETTIANNITPVVQ
jgi:hypothetical protein